MQAVPLGKITITTAGTPVHVLADATVFAQAVIFSPVVGSGRVYVGNAAMNKATGVGVLAELGVNPDRFVLEAEDGNLLRVADYYLDGTANGDAAYVTYLQR